MSERERVREGEKGERKGKRREGGERERREREVSLIAHTYTYMCVCVRASERTCVDVLPCGVSVCVRQCSFLYVSASVDPLRASIVTGGGSEARMLLRPRISPVRVNLPPKQDVVRAVMLYTMSRTRIVVVTIS